MIFPCPPVANYMYNQGTSFHAIALKYLTSLSFTQLYSLNYSNIKKERQK